MRFWIFPLSRNKFGIRWQARTYCHSSYPEHIWSFWSRYTNKYVYVYVYVYAYAYVYGYVYVYVYIYIYYIIYVFLWHATGVPPSLRSFGAWWNPSCHLPPPPGIAWHRKSGWNAGRKMASESHSQFIVPILENGFGKLLLRQFGKFYNPNLGNSKELSALMHSEAHVDGN